MSRLVLVRHGETIWHQENRYAGISDIPLTPHGLEQAELLAQWAAAANISSIWSSPLSRALATAEHAARAAKLTIRKDARLRELDFGRAEGKTLAEMEKEFPAETRAFQSDPVTHPFPDGEDPRAVAQRAVVCFHEIAQAHPGERILVVAHNTLIRLALCRLIGIPLETYRTVFPSLRNGALTEIRIEGGKTALLQFNAPLTFDCPAGK
jgi:broad specificity phosphatase PhoE